MLIPSWKRYILPCFTLTAGILKYQYLSSYLSTHLFTEGTLSSLCLWAQCSCTVQHTNVHPASHRPPLPSLSHVKEICHTDSSCPKFESLLLSTYITRPGLPSEIRADGKQQLMGSGFLLWKTKKCSTISLWWWLYQPVNVLENNELYTFNKLITVCELYQQLCLSKCGICYYPHFTNWERGLARLGHLPTATQLAHGGDRIKSHTVSTRKYLYAQLPHSSAFLRMGLGASRIIWNATILQRSHWGSRPKWEWPSKLQVELQSLDLIMSHHKSREKVKSWKGRYQREEEKKILNSYISTLTILSTRS